MTRHLPDCRLSHTHPTLPDWAAFPADCPHAPQKLSFVEVLRGQGVRHFYPSSAHCSRCLCCRPSCRLASFRLEPSVRDQPVPCRFCPDALCFAFRFHILRVNIGRRERRRLALLSRSTYIESSTSLSLVLPALPTPSLPDDFLRQREKKDRKPLSLSLSLLLRRALSSIQDTQLVFHVP